jgi:AmiR/NasT family two-component response regulator
MGMLMERHQCSAELAFDMLRVASEAVNLRLGDLAEQVVHTGMDPHLLPPLARGPIETAGPG